MSLNLSEIRYKKKTYWRQPVFFILPLTIIWRKLEWQNLKLNSFQECHIALSFHMKDIWWPIFSRPCQSQGKLYYHRCKWCIMWVSYFSSSSSSMNCPSGPIQSLVKGLITHIGISLGVFFLLFSMSLCVLQIKCLLSLLYNGGVSRGMVCGCGCWC